MSSSEGFQRHFSIISKFVCCGFYMKKNVAFTLISFALLKWHQCLSVQLPFENTCWDTSSVASRAGSELTSSEEFQQHFSIISKFVCFGFYIKKDKAFTLISFALLKWDECLSVQLPFELPFQIPVQLLLELEPNLLAQNVIELEFELSRM